MIAGSDSGGERNFKPANLEWFYHIYTPLSSYALTYNEQCFIGLGWGDDEVFAGKKQGEWSLGGFLPRATQGISDSQIKLLKGAVELEKSKKYYLCSHFTYVNYDIKHPITEVDEVNYNNKISTHGKHDFGTFEQNRNGVYELLAKENNEKNKIHYTLSGHSHRSGLYHITDPDKSWIRSNMRVQGQASQNKIFSPKAGCKILVAACGGPIAVQSHANELFNWSMDYPSGNVIKAHGSISIKTPSPSISQAKPRLAVALDYADIFLREESKNQKGFFETFIPDKTSTFKYSQWIHESIYKKQKSL